MNREPDFDQTLRDWLDEGSDHAPERFIWAALDDVERSAQRGAWRVSLEERFVNLKPAALVLVTAAVIIAAIAAYQLVAGPNVGDPGPSPTPQPTAASFRAVDLPDIVLTAANAPDGLTVDGNEFGEAALLVPLRPGGPAIDQAAFVDARMTRLNSTDTSGYVSWAALFETVADAQVAFEYLVTEHESVDGWGLDPGTPLGFMGDEAVSYTGSAYGWESSEIYLWRVGNLVLAAVRVGDPQMYQVSALASLMNTRAYALGQ